MKKAAGTMLEHTTVDCARPYKTARDHARLEYTDPCYAKLFNTMRYPDLVSESLDSEWRRQPLNQRWRTNFCTSACGVVLDLPPLAIALLRRVSPMRFLSSSGPRFRVSP